MPNQHPERTRRSEHPKNLCLTLCHQGKNPTASRGSCSSAATGQHSVFHHVFQNNLTPLILYPYFKAQKTVAPWSIEPLRLISGHFCPSVVPPSPYQPQHQPRPSLLLLRRMGLSPPSVKETLTPNFPRRPPRAYLHGVFIIRWGPEVHFSFVFKAGVVARAVPGRRVPLGLPGGRQTDRPTTVTLLEVTGTCLLFVPSTGTSCLHRSSKLLTRV